MAIIHNTTMSPTKLELLTAWLPTQPWYVKNGEPELTKVGGFRLDDPKGEVGIEFMLVADRATTYQVPMTYRAAPLDGAGDALIGTAEHGVLGPRYIYDGPRDPVLVAQLAALIQGDTKPQAQNVSNTADPTVIARPATNAAPIASASEDPSGTDLHVDTNGGGRLLIRINRILRPAEDTGQPGVSAPWRLPDGTRVRGILATAQQAS
jgi:hypothetical protein